MIHALPQEQYGATHVREGGWRIDRTAQTMVVELEPGTVDAGGEFVPHPRMNWTESRIGPDRWEDFVSFTDSEFDAGDRPKATLALSAALEYMTLVDAGMRPL